MLTTGDYGMQEEDRAKLDRIALDRQQAHEDLTARGSRVYQAFLDIERATYADGALEKRLKELIAVGISVVVDCESCMEWHIGQALRAGASEAQVLEAIEVAIEMGGGPATVSSRFALKALDYHQQARPGRVLQRRARRGP
jgi:AhpD family alkylhydroperoxidase